VDLGGSVGGSSTPTLSPIESIACFFEEWACRAAAPLLRRGLTYAGSTNPASSHDRPVPLTGAHPFGPERSMSNPSVNKRQKERDRQEKQKEKQAKRAERAAEKAARPAGEEGIDPDIAGIVPGPQPRNEEE
jgi:hypothetical protein